MTNRQYRNRHLRDMERIRKLEMYEQVVTECRSLLSTPDEMSLKQHLIALSTVFERLNKAQRWIPVEEQLPEIGARVWAVDKRKPKVDCNEFLGHAVNGRPVWLKSSSMTHWMPLPEPPKEVEK